jgi:hypothetical protein
MCGIGGTVLPVGVGATTGNAGGFTAGGAPAGAGADGGWAAPDGGRETGKGGAGAAGAAAAAAGATGTFGFSLNFPVSPPAGAEAGA